ncbi:hypothetical protein [Brevundimonas nasdae]|uniref:hypothetical protein n=1 Tax=Brevundimonas nasdae TaxID=172043 RepID=UPI00289AF9FE|nr:hypothetical protein [Brevundimonas nasdae]
MVLKVDSGDWPGWIGAITGIGALIWNGVRAYRAHRLQNELLITGEILRSGTGDQITVRFRGAEPHTAYGLTIACTRPSKLQISVMPETTADLMYGTLDWRSQPVTLPMKRTKGDPSVVEARFYASGSSSKAPLVLTLTVRDATKRVRAKRKLPLSQA